MEKPRDQYSAAFKFQVALAATQGDKTIHELASELEYIPTKSANGSNNYSKPEPAYSIASGSASNMSERPTRPIPSQVWCADITYVPVSGGFMYLVAILDWFSRYVLVWQVSNTLEGYFCVEALHQALGRGQPEVFNTDQGVRFTAGPFISTLAAAGVRISMDGRGRVFDNIFVERLWHTVKYEDIYVQDYATVPALRAGLLTTRNGCTRAWGTKLRLKCIWALPKRGQKSTLIFAIRGLDFGANHSTLQWMSERSNS